MNVRSSHSTFSLLSQHFSSPHTFSEIKIILKRTGTQAMANVSEVESVPLFDDSILKDIDLSKGKCKLHECGLSISNPGHPFCMRPLCSDDMEKGFLNLLSQLTKIGNITREQFLNRFNRMRGCPETYYVIVIENTELNEVVACGTLVVEQKFIHETATRGLVEDIVVGENCRGKKFGKLIVETLLLLSEKLGCYKTSLVCTDLLHSFYAQFGFHTEHGANYLVYRWTHD